MWNDVGEQSQTESTDLQSGVKTNFKYHSSIFLNRLKLWTHNFGYSYMVWWCCSFKYKEAFTVHSDSSPSHNKIINSTFLPCICTIRPVSHNMQLYYFQTRKDIFITLYIRQLKLCVSTLIDGSKQFKR